MFYRLSRQLRKTQYSCSHINHIPRCVNIFSRYSDLQWRYIKSYLNNFIELPWVLRTAANQVTTTSYNSGKPNYYQHDIAHGDRQSPSDVQILYLTVESLLKGC